MKGLTPGVTILDIEKFARENYDTAIENSKDECVNLDYIDGIKDTLRELLDNYFRGV